LFRRVDSDRVFAAPSVKAFLSLSFLCSSWQSAAPLAADFFIFSPFPPAYVNVKQIYIVFDIFTFHHQTGFQGKQPAETPCGNGKKQV